MIGYLEQLERDLVEAIDQRAAARAERRRLPRRPLRRPDWALVAAVAVAVLVLAIVIAVVRPGSGGHHAGQRPPPPTKKVHHRPAPIPPGTPLRLVGLLTRVDRTTWRGQARGPGGPGTLTITGIVDIAGAKFCGTARCPSSSITRHRVRFRWTSPEGTVEGCLANSVLRRPHGRWVWDGAGRFTRATGALARYRRLGVGVAGETRTSTPGRARIILGAGELPPQPC
jgi:hypothetical protein